MRIGFVGLGMMGKPIAVNLVKAGHDVTVVNRSQGKVQELAAMGARAGAVPADAARGAEIVALCLVEEETVERILCGPDGVLSAVEPGAVVLDHSTVHPEFARRMAGACAAQGAVYLDAPVSGSGEVAWEGRLTVMIGGDPAAFARVQPVLDAVAANALLLGPVGSGNMAKLINNMVKDINLVAVMEAFVLAAKLGMDCAALFEVMRRASAASRQLERLIPKTLDRTFTQTTYVSTNVKDQEHTGWLIEQAGLTLPLRNAARDHWKRAADEGLGAADSSEAIRVLEREAGVEVRGALPAADAPAAEPAPAANSPRIAFIGLGLMGRPIAENLVKAGLDVTVVNRSQGKVQELAAMGARAGAVPADAARGAEIVALCLVEEETVERILCGPDGVLSAVEPGAVVLDHSTVHPEFARRMAGACAAQGAVYLDAPVSGSGEVAWEGRLTVMIGGDPAAFARVQPVLDAVAANALLLGPVGSGNMAKLINNMVKDINLVAVMEAFVLAAKLGMDCAALFEVMRRASAASRQLERLIPKTLDRTFTQTTYVSTNVKDQEHTGWLIEQAGLTLPLRNAARDHWKRAADEGLGAADSSEAIRVLEREAGVEVRHPSFSPDRGENTREGTPSQEESAGEGADRRVVVSPVADRPGAREGRGRRSP